MQSPTLVIWIAGVVTACVLLANMMRRRQSQLTDLLRGYVQEQREWAQKRAKAAKLAHETYLSKAAQEKAFAESLARHSHADGPMAQPAAAEPLVDEAESESAQADGQDVPTEATN